MKCLGKELLTKAQLRHHLAQPQGQTKKIRFIFISATICFMEFGIWKNLT